MDRQGRVSFLSLDTSTFTTFTDGFLGRTSRYGELDMTLRNIQEDREHREKKSAHVAGFVLHQS